MYDLLLGAATFLLFVLAVSPAITYLLTTWKSGRSQLVSRLRPESVARYFQCFPDRRIKLPEHPPGRSEGIDERYQEAFKEFYDRHFGWRLFLVPLVVYGLLVLVLLVLSALSVGQWLELREKTPGSLPHLAVVAFAGAYVFVVYRQIDAAFSQQLVPGDLMRSALRLAMAIPIGYAVAGLFKEALALPLVFILGVFPLGDTVRILRRLAIKKFNIGDSPTGDEESELQRELQGVDQRNAERFANQGVTTLLQLAYRDPIKLMILTNLEFSYVIDCVSQAQLRLYLGDGIDKTRRFGLRGAQEAMNLYDEYRSKDQETKQAAETIFQRCASELDMELQELIRVVAEVVEDPYAEFLHRFWTAASPEEEGEEEEQQEQEEGEEEDND